MLNKLQDWFVEKSNHSISYIQKYSLFLGLGGLCSILVKLIIDWILYPKFLIAVLADAEPHIRFGILFQIESFHILDIIGTILIGLGFFAVLNGNEIKEKFLFLFLYFFPLFDIYASDVFLSGGYPIFDVASILYLIDYLRIIITTIILSYFLFNARSKFKATKLVAFVSFMLVMIKAVPFILYFLSEPLRLHYDEALHLTVGSLAGPLIIIGVCQITIIIGIISFGILFFRELRKDRPQSDSPSILERTPIESIQS